MKPTQERALKNLLDFKAILDEIGVPFFLDGGTLLGAYRDKNFCEDDENDIDLAAMTDYQHHIPEIIRKAKAKGFELWRHWPGDARAPGKAQEISMTRGAARIPGLNRVYPLKIDLYFYERKGEVAWTCVYDGKNVCTPRVVPLRHVESLETLLFHGTEFRVPNDLERYLSWTYGDWKTKKHRSTYSCYDPKDLKALQPNFEPWK